MTIMTMKKSAVAAIVLLAVSAAAVAAATRWRVTPDRFQGVSHSGSVTIVDGAGRSGSLRAGYVLPSNWRRDSGLTKRSIRFDTRNSCHHKVTFTPRLVEAAEQSAEDRAASIAPGTRRYLQAFGTREDAAFRVVRTRGTDGLTGVLVQPLPRGNSRGVPAGRRVFAEIHARAVAGRVVECHSGGPRTVGDAIGNAFGAGSAGGFVHTR